MQYKCRTVSLSKLIIGQKGFVMPMCDQCKTNDCENPIEFMNVSILGVTEKHRVYIQNRSAGIVVDCEGFIG